MPARKRFRGKGRYFRPERASGLAVVDVPQDVATALGGLRQLRVKAPITGWISSPTPCRQVAGPRLSVSKKLLDSAGLNVGDAAEIEIERT